MKTIKQIMKEDMLALPFVNFDRFVDLDTSVFLYGWINREKDSYKDFVIIKYDNVKDLDNIETFFSTSSDKYSEVIHKNLGFNEGEHCKCQRVEDNFEIMNCIRLTKHTVKSEKENDKKLYYNN